MRLQQTDAYYTRAEPQPRALQGNRNSRTEVIFQTVPTDQVGRSLKALSTGALAKPRFRPGLQVAPQGDLKVVSGPRPYHLCQLGADVPRARGSCSHQRAETSPQPRLSSPLQASSSGDVSPNAHPDFWTTILGSVVEAQLQ